MTYAESRQSRGCDGQSDVRVSRRIDAVAVCHPVKPGPLSTTASVKTSFDGGSGHVAGYRETKRQRSEQGQEGFESGLRVAGFNTANPASSNSSAPTASAIASTLSTRGSGMLMVRLRSSLLPLAPCPW